MQYRFYNRCVTHYHLFQRNDKIFLLWLDERAYTNTTYNAIAVKYFIGQHHQSVSIPIIIAYCWERFEE